VRSRVECGAIVVMLVGVVLGLILVVVWETVYTPAVHLADDSNSTVSVVADSTAHNNNIIIIIIIII